MRRARTPNYMQSRRQRPPTESQQAQESTVAHLESTTHLAGRALPAARRLRQQAYLDPTSNRWTVRRRHGVTEDAQRRARAESGGGRMTTERPSEPTAPIEPTEILPQRDGLDESFPVTRGGQLP